MVITIRTSKAALPEVLKDVQHFGLSVQVAAHCEDCSFAEHWINYDCRIEGDSPALGQLVQWLGAIPVRRVQGFYEYPATCA